MYTRLLDLEKVPHLEIIEVKSVHSNIVNNDHQHDSIKYLFRFFIENILLLSYKEFFLLE